MTGSIQVEHVGKRFVLSRQRATHLREAVARRLRRNAAGDGTEFWALDDVSFAIQPGEAVGIVGHNGSGKSTMLKLLTGILQPTRGTIRASGRVGALIEVGAGFHPDLSGRENVYLNGSILGLTRREITRRMDAIVAFAGLEKFLDTPVKRYSSGMYMRLGFSIAVHTNPDILLIDEVLAVGDTQFQRKCMHRMQEFRNNGGTVVFVSHAMGFVADLCPRCIWLDHGKLLYDGETTEAVERYMALVSEREDAEFQRMHPEEWALMEAERLQIEEERRREEERLRAEEEERLQASRPQLPAHGARLLGVRLLDAEGHARTELLPGEPIRVQMRYRFTRPLPCPAFCFEIYRSDGLHMFTTSNYEHDLVLSDLPLEGKVIFDVPYLTLSPGRYHISLRLFSDWNVEDWYACVEDIVENALEFTVVPGRFPNGAAYLPVQWSETASGAEAGLIPAGQVA